MNQNENIKLLKRLIKTYHPDLCSNINQESIYSEITKKLTNKLNEIKEKNRFKDNISDIKAETDYMYYKTGVKYYNNIHPDKLYKRNTDSTYQTKTYNECIAALKKILLSFNISEYFFYKIINEYPQSPYYDDSLKKIKLLKKLRKSYDNSFYEENKIIDSNKYISEMGLKIL